MCRQTLQQRCWDGSMGTETDEMILPSHQHAAWGLESGLGYLTEHADMRAAPANLNSPEEEGRKEGKGGCREQGREKKPTGRQADKKRQTEGEGERRL